jgi:hypothetical protein
VKHCDHKKEQQEEARFARDGLRPFSFVSDEEECKSDAIAKVGSESKSYGFENQEERRGTP